MINNNIGVFYDNLIEPNSGTLFLGKHKNVSVKTVCKNAGLQNVDVYPELLFFRVGRTVSHQKARFPHVFTTNFQHVSWKFCSFPLVDVRRTLVLSHWTAKQILSHRRPFICNLSLRGLNFRRSYNNLEDSEGGGTQILCGL
jgi:hypothetical protein